MPAKFNKKVFVLAIVLQFITAVSYPCGPFLPNRVLEGGDDYVLKSPEGFFFTELKRIKMPNPPEFIATGAAADGGIRYHKQAENNRKTVEADLIDLRAALSDLNDDELKRRNIVAKYNTARQVIVDYTDSRTKWQRNRKFEGKRFDINQNPPREFVPPMLPDGLPGEFEDYLRGAILYHQEQFEEAKSVWERLLQRPAGQRKYKSTWAAYMIGKVLLDSNPKEATRWFRFVRELTGKVFVDSLGLSASSTGWEARAELNQGHYGPAIELYMAQLATGDRTAPASLQIVCSQVLKADSEILEKVATNPLACKVISAYILSRGGPFHQAPRPDVTRKWLKAVERTNIRNMDQAGRFAWAAYSVGDTNLAAQWIAKAPKNDTMAQWIEAKLLLREGETTEAAKKLGQIARIIAPMGAINNYQRFNYQERPYASGEPFVKIIRGELGALYLSQRNYIEALDSLLRGGYWEDAAYIAERILTVDELKTYIDKTQWITQKQDNSTGTQSKLVGTRLRFLLARRLTRLDRFEDARPYYPIKWQSRLDAYTKAIRNGNRRQLSKAERAVALWKAAVIARYEGMELMGTELEPDWFIYDGSSFHRKPMKGIREGKHSEKIVPSSSDEIQRIQQTITPDKRFHYRYIAAELAWWAAEHMPDNSDRTARVLCIAGSWLKAKYPQAADKFYKALVMRCRKTSLGREAEKLRWFPNIEFSGIELLKEVESMPQN